MVKKVKFDAAAIDAAEVEDSSQQLARHLEQSGGINDRSFRRSKFDVPSVDDQLLENQWKKSAPSWAVKYMTQKNSKKSSSTPETVAGITQFMRSEEDVKKRPEVLIRWTFDDTVISEVPRDAKQITACSGDQEAQIPADEAERISPKGEDTKSYEITVVVEGLTQSQVAQAVGERLTAKRGQVLFLTPMDFLASCESTLLLRNLTRAQFDQVRTLTSLSVNNVPVFFHSLREPVASPYQQRDGASISEKSQEDKAKDMAKVVPNTLMGVDALPDMRYSMMLRDGTGSLADYIKAAESVKNSGFVNYTSITRHGDYLSKSYRFAKAAMSREYLTCVSLHLRNLCEGSSAIRSHVEQLLRVLNDASNLNGTPKVNAREWELAAAGVAATIKNESRVFAPTNTGLNGAHLIALQEFLTRGISYSQGDTSALIREGIPRHALQDKVAAATDVHWNYVASLRLQVHGRKVVPGDLVCTDRSLIWDAEEYPNDVVPSMFPYYAPWGRGFPELDRPGARDSIHLVQSDEEARQYNITDVVLPKLGSWKGLGANNCSDEFVNLVENHSEEIVQFPQNDCNEATYQALAQKLRLSAIPEMKLSPIPTYRRLVVKPRDVTIHSWNDMRGFEFGDGITNDPVKGKISSDTFMDIEGVRRQKSPIATFKPNQKVGRSGLKDREDRQEFAMAAKRQASSRVQFTLPRGSAPSSMLREMFVLASIGTEQMFDILSPFNNKSATLGGGHVRGRGRGRGGAGRGGRGGMMRGVPRRR